MAVRLMAGAIKRLRPTRSEAIGRFAQNKGPLAVASGPSLGRKRPRRAAVTRGATAPQQHATATHKKQVSLTYSLYIFCMAGLPQSRAGRGPETSVFQVFIQ